LIHDNEENAKKAAENVTERFRAALFGEKKFRDIDSLLDVCSDLQREMINTFDACMSQQPQRREIIAMFMENGHTQMMSILTKFWEKHSVHLSAFETLSVIDWCQIYIKDLKRFGVTDVYLQNGLNNLCNAYSRKIHSQINPLVVNILKQEIDYQNAV